MNDDVLYQSAYGVPDKAINVGKPAAFTTARNELLNVLWLVIRTTKDIDTRNAAEAAKDDLVHLQRGCEWDYTTPAGTQLSLHVYDESQI